MKIVNKPLLIAGLSLLAMVVPLVSYAASAQGGDISSFDVSPKVITAQNRSVTFTFSVTIYEPQFKSYCGSGNNDKFIWKISEQVAIKDEQIRYGEQSIDNTQASKVYKLDFATTLPAKTTSPTRSFVAKIACSNGILWDTPISTSSPITITQGGAVGTAYACVANGKYECSPAGKSDCSDQPKCSGVSGCSPVDINKCGQAAPASGGTGSATCGVPGKPACATGTDKSYPFRVPNWLSGEPQSLTDLLDTLARWLMNIAIPIAVLLIIYSGLIYVTSRGDPKKVTQAQGILRAVVIGLVIIFIGKGFISLIRSILELGISS